MLHVSTNSYTTVIYITDGDSEALGTVEFSCALRIQKFSSDSGLVGELGVASDSSAFCAILQLAQTPATSIVYSTHSQLHPLHCIPPVAIYNSSRLASYQLDIIT